MIDNSKRAIDLENKYGISAVIKKAKEKGTLSL